MLHVSLTNISYRMETEERHQLLLSKQERQKFSKSDYRNGIKYMHSTNSMTNVSVYILYYNIV